MSRNLGALTLLDPSGPAWPVMGVLYLYLAFILYLMKWRLVDGGGEILWKKISL
jgi:hypothetical protein